MALFRRKGPHQDPPPAPTFSSSTQSSAVGSVPADPVRVARSSDWSDIDSIRAEWPKSALDREADLKKRDEGISLYNQGPEQSPASALRSATLLAPSLAHSLCGEGILRGQDLIDTVYKTLLASLGAAGERTIPEEAKRTARLALTLVRENGWQPAAMGGDGLFDNILTQTYAALMLPAVIGPRSRPWEGDLKGFFAVPPKRLLPALPDPEREQRGEVVNRMHALLTQDHDDDAGIALHQKGMLLWAGGNSDQALAALTEAAQLGAVQAMKDAGDLAREMGQDEKSWFWYETAANAGNADCMWNMATRHFNSGDLAGAADWYQKAAEAGLPDGYAALTQLASDRDDAPAERYWAKLGAECGQTFCVGRYGLLLLMDAPDDVPTMRRAREFLEQAADRGDLDAMSLAVNVNAQLGDSDRGQRFIKMVVDSGNDEQIDRLRRYGFL